MAYEVDSQNVGLGYVAPRPVIRKNIEAFSNALNKIDAKAQEALKQRTAIQTALSQVELDSSEDEWKAKYIQDIKFHFLQRQYLMHLLDLVLYGLMLV